MREDFNPYALRLVKDDVLFKLASNPIKVMAEHGHLACLALVQYC